MREGVRREKVRGGSKRVSERGREGEGESSEWVREGVRREKVRGGSKRVSE